MADTFDLTNGPVNVGGGTVAPIWSAKDVTGYDLIDLEVELLSWDGGSLAPFQVFIVTTLQRDSLGFSANVQQFTMSSSVTKALVTLDTSLLLKYLFWQVGATGATNTWISMRGIGRASEDA